MSARLSSASALLGAVSLAASGAAFGACTGLGAPTTEGQRLLALRSEYCCGWEKTQYA